MARRCSSLTVLTTFVRILVVSILMMISSSFQPLTPDEMMCYSERVVSSTCCSNAPGGVDCDKCCLKPTFVSSPNVTSLCTYGTDFVSDINCSNTDNATVHFFAWFSCVSLTPVVYWKTVDVHENKTTCSSNLTVQFTGRSISLISYGFLSVLQEFGDSIVKKLFNITIGAYEISEKGNIKFYPGSRLPSTCPISTSIQPDSTSYTTTALALTTSTNINIVSSTSISVIVSVTSATSTTPTCDCSMAIQHTEPWVHVLYCVIIVIIILISVIVFLLIFIHQQKNKGHYTFHGGHTSSNIYNTRRRQNDEFELPNNADMYASIPLPYTTQENKRVLSRTPSEYLDPVSMRKNRTTTSELRELSPTIEQPDMHTYELVVRKNKTEEVQANGKENNGVDRLLEQACKESEDSQQADIDGKDTMELLPQMDPTYDYVQLPWNSQQNTMSTKTQDVRRTQDAPLSTAKATDDRVSNDCTVYSNTCSDVEDTNSREDKEATSSAHERETKETKDESEKESEFEDDDDISLEMSKV